VASLSRSLIHLLDRKRSQPRVLDWHEAEVVFAEWLQTRARKHGPTDPSKILVTDVLTNYATERAPKVAAPRVIGCAIDSLSGFWQGRTIVEVTPYACGRYADWRARSQNTIRRELAVLQAAINYAHRNGKNHARRSGDASCQPPSKERWLTKREASLLLRASRTEKARLYLPLFILLGLYTGRRKEAILSLRWPQVNLGAGLIDFEVAGRQRTNKKRGKVPIPRKLLSHLKRARRRGSDLGYVLHINGEPIGDIKKGFAAACRRAGIEGVTPHTLRHTAATWLMQKGVDLWQASGFLAMSEKTLVEVYGHHHPELMREAAEAIGKSIPQNFRVIR
jgi:integrase